MELNHNNNNSQNARVLLISLKSAQIWLGQMYHTKKDIAALFDLVHETENIILLDAEGEEAPCELFFNFFLNILIQLKIFSNFILFY